MCKTIEHVTGTEARGVWSNGKGGQDRRGPKSTAQNSKLYSAATAAKEDL